MKATRMVLALAFLGLVVSCEPGPAGPEMQTAAVAPVPAFFAPAMGNMGMNKGATIHKDDIGCRLIDGDGYLFPYDGWTLPCNTELATNSKNLNAMIVVHSSGVPNSTGKTVRWDPYNPGPDWMAAYPELTSGPYPCFLLGADYDLDNPLFTINWRAWVTPSGEGTLICIYQKKWEFQWPDLD